MSHYPHFRKEIKSQRGRKPLVKKQVSGDERRVEEMKLFWVQKQNEYKSLVYINYINDIYYYEVPLAAVAGIFSFLLALFLDPLPLHLRILWRKSVEDGEEERQAWGGGVYTWAGATK